MGAHGELVFSPACDDAGRSGKMGFAALPGLHLLGCNGRTRSRHRRAHREVPYMEWLRCSGPFDVVYLASRYDVGNAVIL